MVIYVVRPGDSVWSIARRYGVSMDAISAANRLEEIPGIVVGQALVVPTREQAYSVVSGDSLWSIAQKFGVTVPAILALNAIPPPYVLYPGMVLRIPQVSKQYGAIRVNAYIEPSTAANETRLIDEVGRYLTCLSPFSYRVRADGSLIPIDDGNMLAAAGRYGIIPMMVLTNFSGGTFDTDLGHTILSSPGIQRLVIGNVLDVMNRKGYKVLNIDFERIFPNDRDLYSAFLQRVVAALHPSGYQVATALAPKTSGEQTGAWYTAHDYGAHGQIVDFVIIMTYEWGWSGGPPMAVAPIDQVRAVLNYAVTVIPRNKIMMGMPLYGYDWTLPYTPQGQYARRVSPQQAYSLALRYGAYVRYDTTAQSPYFNYYDTRGAQHIVWFEDARSVRAKLLLANEMRLRGVSYWELGPSFPQNWLVLDDMFTIVKTL